MPVEKGNKVKVNYVGTLEDGSVFDESKENPLEFEAGAGQMIPGFDAAVIGMEKGEEKNITLSPDEAYGQPKDNMVQEVPKDKLPQDQEIKEGMMLVVGLPTGQQMPAQIVGVTDSTVKIDLNHPLAGKTLNFKITMVDFS